MMKKRPRKSSRNYLSLKNNKSNKNLMVTVCLRLNKILKNNTMQIYVKKRNLILVKVVYYQSLDVLTKKSPHKSIKRIPNRKKKVLKEKQAIRDMVKIVFSTSLVVISQLRRFSMLLTKLCRKMMMLHSRTNSQRQQMQPIHRMD